MPNGAKSGETLEVVIPAPFDEESMLAPGGDRGTLAVSAVTVAPATSRDSDGNVTQVVGTQPLDISQYGYIEGPKPVSMVLMKASPSQQQQPQQKAAASASVPFSLGFYAAKCSQEIPPKLI